MYIMNEYVYTVMCNFNEFYDQVENFLVLRILASSPLIKGGDDL